MVEDEMTKITASTNHFGQQFDWQSRFYRMECYAFNI